MFVANEGLIKQLPTPLSVHVYRLVWRQMILFAHNIIIFVVIAIIYPQAVVVDRPAFIPALGLIVLNCVWVALCFGILATRYRDISPLLFSLVQLLFFMTPIIWNEETLRQQGAGAWAKIVELNPLLHYLDIVRAPLLGADQELRHWIVVMVLTRSAGSSPHSPCGSTAPACRTGSRPALVSPSTSPPAICRPMRGPGWPASGGGARW